MSRSFSVVVLCCNGRRETVKVTPNCSILQVLEEACTKQKLCPEDYDIRHYNKTLDLSLPIRFANLPNNALLELRPVTRSRQDCLVTVCLQLESGERLTKDFPPSSTIYNVLEQCLSSQSISLQDIEDPVCIYMRQKITGDSINSTTLRSLGLINGKAIIRLLCRKPEELEHQAHVSSPLTATTPIEHKEVRQPIEHKKVRQPIEHKEGLQPIEQRTISSPDKQPSPGSPIPEQVRKQARLDDTVKDEDTVSGMKITVHDSVMEVDCNENAMKEDIVGKTSIINNTDMNFCSAATSKVDNSDLKAKMDCDSNTIEDTFEGIGDIKYIGERHAVLYSLDDITDVKKADLPDEFFDLTINDAKYLMTEYQRQRSQLENQPLLTKNQRQNQILQKLAHYNRAVIRIYFPERLVLQAVFTSIETVQAVSEFVQNYLEDRNLNFYLYITPPKEKLNPSKTLLEAMLVPAAVVYFGCDTLTSCYLASNLRSSLSDPRAAALAASESWKSSFSNEPLNVLNQISLPEETAVANVSMTTNVPQYSAQKEQEKLPKWLKLSKK